VRTVSFVALIDTLRHCGIGVVKSGRATRFMICLAVGHALKADCRGTKAGGSERYWQPTELDS
jgi:hypothetical protein